VALPSLRSSRPPPSWVPLLHAHYGRFLARTDPLPPVRAALRLFPEHEHRPSPHRTGLPPSRPHPLWPFRRQSPDGPASSLLRATLQRGARTESPLSDFAFYPAGSSDASGRIAFVILRTGPPPPIAPHAASRRRSYRQFQAGERMPGEDLHLSGCVRLEAHRAGRRSRPLSDGDNGVAITNVPSRSFVLGAVGAIAAREPGRSHGSVFSCPSWPSCASWLRSSLCELRALSG